MDALQEKDLHRVRLRFLDLIKSFFVEEPDAEKLARWRGTFSALAAEHISPGFDSAVREISRVLRERNLKELRDEYYKLFVDPFDGAMIETTASYYLNGRNYDQALVGIRALMDDAGIRKKKAFSQPEDSLVVMLDTFYSMVEVESGGGAENIRPLQEKLLEEFLLPTADKFSAALRESEHGDFYHLCCRILNSYLELEKGLILSV
ncbi:MAG: TorD/DmsD family molecular chaperone [Desulforhopalus sp.]